MIPSPAGVSPPWQHRESVASEAGKKARGRDSSVVLRFPVGGRPRGRHLPNGLPDSGLLKAGQSKKALVVGAVGSSACVHGGERHARLVVAKLAHHDEKRLVSMIEARPEARSNDSSQNPEPTAIVGLDQLDMHRADRPIAENLGAVHLRRDGRLRGRIVEVFVGFVDQIPKPGVEPGVAHRAEKPVKNPRDAALGKPTTGLPTVVSGQEAQSPTRRLDLNRVKRGCRREK